MLITLIIILINSIVTFLCVALAVGFYTLIERNVLSYIQTRNGPNKVGIIGLPQPLADAAKLFTNENPTVNNSNNLFYILSPVLAVAVIFSLWTLYTSSYYASPFNLGILFFFAVSSLNVYCILLSGWASNSKYALLGAIRAVAQTISYEVSIALCIIAVILLSWEFDFLSISNVQGNFWFLLLILPIFSIWFTTALAETNRAPFDLAEGESELVSGFNIEYGSGEFSLLFIAEYGSILLISIITSSLFIGGQLIGLGIDNLANALIIAYLFLWVRGSYPRIRYDTLISLTWKSFLLITITLAGLLVAMNNF